MTIIGNLEFCLIGAKGLKGADFMGKNDPYALIAYKGQNQKSIVIQGGGAAPIWNQKFNFQVDDDSPDDIIVKIYDEDKHSSDDLLGEAKVPITKVIADKNVPNTSFDVIQPSGHKHGTIQVSMTFTPKAGGSCSGSSCPVSCAKKKSKS